MRKYFRIIYYFGGILLFVFVAIIGTRRPGPLKRTFANFSYIESLTAIDGELQLGVIDGNLITGFRINSVTVTESGVELLSAQRVELKYDPLGFIFKRVGIGNVVIAKPSIHIYRSIDGSTNIARLIKPTPVDTTSSAWNIDIKRLELVDAEVFYTDSLILLQRQIGEREVQPDSVIDYARIHLQGLALVISAQIQNNKYTAKVKNLSGSIYRNEQFVSAATENLSTGKHQVPVFTLNHFNGDFLLTKNEASVHNVIIETPMTHIHFDAGIKGIDITHLSSMEELKSIPVDISLLADDIDTRELKQFLHPSLDFLDHALKLKLKATGTFGKLNVEEFSGTNA